MELFITGSVVVVPFPFSDNSGVKKRPAFVVKDLPGEDIILCQITASEHRKSPFNVKIINSDFSSGSLRSDESFVRCEKISTCTKNKIIYTIGNLENSKTKKVIDNIIKIIKS